MPGRYGGNRSGNTLTNNGRNSWYHLGTISSKGLSFKSLASIALLMSDKDAWNIVSLSLLTDKMNEAPLRILISSRTGLWGRNCGAYISSSAKIIFVWADWLRQSGRAPSETSGTPRWRITLHLASIPHVALHIALQSPFRHFFSLCWSPIWNKHSGIVANCDHTSEWVYCVHACIGIAWEWVTLRKSLLTFHLH
jgi:hypothetical protein